MKTLPVRIGIAALALFLTIIGIFITLFTIDYVRYPGLIKRAASLRVGMTRSEVIEIMGSPTGEIQYGVLFDSDGNRIDPRVATMIYGRAYTFRDAFFSSPPYFFPLRIRLTAMEGDVWIRLREETVTQVNLPETTK